MGGNENYWVVRKACLVSLLLLGSALNCWARPPRPILSPAPISHDFVDADLVQVVKSLAKAMGRNAYIGPGVDGKVSVSLRCVPPEAALAYVLAMQPNPIAYKFLGKLSVVVASPDKVSQVDSEVIGCNFSGRAPYSGADRTRREFLLKRSVAPLLLVRLKHDYPTIEFIPHIMNGFYAVGSRPDLDQLSEAIPKLDVDPPDLVEESYEVERQPSADLAILVECLVPTLSTRVAPGQSSVLLLRGIPEDVEAGLEWAALLDHAPEEILYDFHLPEWFLTDF